MNIGIIGLGLIGGSLGRAVVSRTEHTVYGLDTDEAAILKGGLLRAYHFVLTEQDFAKLDILIIALCPDAAIEVMDRVCPKLKDGAIVIDTAGTKRKITARMRELSQQYPHLFFEGAHPMAGREFSGISHSTEGLFERAYVIMVPISKDMGAMTAVKSLFMDIGAQDVEICSAEKHDEMIAYTSQLAHIVSSAYVKNPHSSAHAGFSAGSFRDMTRVAKLNPDMWTELFIENRDNLSEDIRFLIARLSEYADALESTDEYRLRSLLEEGVKLKEIAEAARKERLK